MSSDNFSVNLVDLVILLVLLLGIFRGRKHGMSGEALYLVQWLAILFGASAFYEPIGRLFANATVFSLLFSYITAYLTLALLIRTIFELFKRSLGGKLIGSSVFGGSEYYLGMVAGFFRYICIVLFAMALLNANETKPEQAKAMDNFQLENYGKVYFPRLHTVQKEVFESSFIGRLVREHLSFLLITPTPAEAKDLHQKEYQMPQ